MQPNDRAGIIDDRTVIDPIVDKNRRAKPRLQKGLRKKKRDPPIQRKCPHGLGENCTGGEFC